MLVTRMTNPTAGEVHTNPIVILSRIMIGYSTAPNEEPDEQMPKASEHLFLKYCRATATAPKSNRDDPIPVQTPCARNIG
jgi:hypothetical protein